MVNLQKRITGIGKNRTRLLMQEQTITASGTAHPKTNLLLCQTVPKAVTDMHVSRMPTAPGAVTLLIYHVGGIKMNSICEPLRPIELFRAQSTEDEIMTLPRQLKNNEIGILGRGKSVFRTEGRNIASKRCGTSQNLGPAARAKSNAAA
jgi:hypothetical protein